MSPCKCIMFTENPYMLYFPKHFSSFLTKAKSCKDFNNKNGMHAQDTNETFVQISRVAVLSAPEDSKLCAEEDWELV